VWPTKRPRLSLVLELSEEELDALVEQATVDAYNDEEQLGGFAVMIEDNLEIPFETTVLGVMVTVKDVTQTESGIVADCVRDGQHLAISILDLPLPEPPPKGAEWIAAYRHWAR
jgi:Calcium binding